MENNSQDKHIPCTLSQNSTADNLFPWTPEVKTPTRPWGQLILAPKKIKSLGIRHREVLYSDTNTNSHTFDLYSDEYTVGKQGCNLNLTTKELDSKFLEQISRVHFSIKRELIENSPVYLKDLSHNGTYINSEKVGRGKTRILEMNDEIAIGIKRTKVFIFHDWLATANNDVPACIKLVYYICEQIGSGASGVVHLIFNKRNSKQYAMKHIVKSEGLKGLRSLNDPRRIMNEVKIMKKLDHPFVVNIHDIVDTPQAVYLVMAYMNGGDLQHYIIQNKRLEESEAKHIFYQITEAVKYLHSQSIAHRDLKPHNILLHKSQEYKMIAKVSDFGLSKFIDDTTWLRTKCGTTMYIAPEILKSTECYTKKADVWSLGVILYFSLCGTEPFNKDNNLEDQICNAKYSYNNAIWEKVSKLSKNIIDKMLMVDENKRLSIEEVLKDEWLQEDILIKEIFPQPDAKEPTVMSNSQKVLVPGEDNCTLQPPLKKCCSSIDNE